MTKRRQKRADAYLIVKRDVYYKPNAQGYTGVKDHAGRYTLAEVAERFPNKESPNQDGMSFIHEDDAPEYSEGCYWDVRLEHQRDKALAENAAILARLEAVEKERGVYYQLAVEHTKAELEAEARAEAAEAALPAAYRLALADAVANACWADISVNTTVEVVTLEAIRALPTPTPADLAVRLKETE